MSEFSNLYSAARVCALQPASARVQVTPRLRDPTSATQAAKCACLEPSAPPPCVELIPAQVNSGCAVDRHSQRAAWCPGRLVSALMFLDTQQVLESRQMAS